VSWRAGTRLDGRYRLSERIAVGGMGEVWRSTDESLGRSVAVKILRAELAEDVAFRKRFRAEARTAGSMTHPGIAAVFDYGETTVGPNGESPSRNPVQGDGIAYLVMELVPGEPLSAILARDGALGTERTLVLLAQAARALHAAHSRGVVHRDVKPANLIVTPEGRVKVTDFGIARPIDHEPLTMTGQVMGTAHYLAPELARGLEASPLSDVYALGVVAYECLAGHRPFEGDNQVLVATAHLNQQPPPLPGTVPDDVVTVVGAAMQKNPTDRIRSAEVFAIALEKLLIHDPTALDDLGGSGHDLRSAQAPTFGPDGGVTVPRSGSGRHSAGEASGARSSVPDTVGAPGLAAAAGAVGAGGTTLGGNPAGGWRSVATAAQGVPVGGPGGPAGPGGFGADDYYRLGPEPGRRRERRQGLSPALLLILGLIGLIVVIAVVIRLTGGSPGGTVDVGNDPTPSVTGPAGTTTPTTAPSISGSASTSPSTPSRSRSRSASPSPTTTSPSTRPSSPAVSSPPPSSPPPSSPPPSSPPSSPPASTEPSPTVSVTVSPLALLPGGLTGVGEQG